jgi:hypothetical protein
MIDNQVAPSCRDAVRLIERLERDASVRIAILRDDELLEFTLQVDAPAEEKESS